MTTPACDSANAMRELISAQLDDQLSEAEADQLVSHLSGCAECQAHRERLTKAVRLLRSSGPLLPLERAALTDLETQLELTALDEATEEGCDRFIELQSAQLDGELNAEETDALLAHLPRCSVCQAHRRRLQKLDRGIEPELELVRVDEGTFAALDRKLDAALAEEVLCGLRGAPPPAAPPLEFQPAGRVIPFPAQATRIAVAAAVLLLAVLVTWRGYTSFRDLAWDPDPVDPRVQKGDYQPLPTQTPTPAPSTSIGPAIAKTTDAPRPTPNTTQVATTGTPQPTASPSPTIVRGPSPTPTPSPSGSPPPKTRVRDPKPQPTPQPALALAELKTILRQIARGKDDPQVPALIASLGATRFEHDLTYGLLGSVLSGKLDGYADPNACRRSTYQAYGKLGTPRAVKGLLRAPLRRLHADHDAAALSQALTSLQRDDAIGALGSSLLRRRRPLGPEVRLVVVTALADLARPAGGPGLLGVLAARGQPRELVREAARALGRSGHPQAFAELKRILETDRRVLARQGSAFGLGALAARDPKAPVAELAIEELERNLQDKQKLLVSEACVEGLGASRSRGAVAPLITCLGPGEKRATIRRRARLALCTLAGEEPKGVRSAQDWKRWFDGLPPARPVGQRRLDAIDLTSFRRAPARSQGVVFVIDTSGSMANKRDLIEFEFEQALEQLPPRVKFQVLFFGDAPRALWSRRRLAPATLANRRKALAAARAQPIVRVAQTVLKKTLQEALAHAEADAVYLISDGLMTPDDLTSLRPTVRRWNRARTRPAQIHCVHLRDPGRAVRLRLAPPNYRETIWDMDFMHRLAAENDGDYAHN